MLIPAFNEERFLRQCLDSVVDQADCVMIGDNASTDGTAAICREYVDKYRHVRSIRHETNVGSIQNLVDLAGLVETEYVFQMGAHDALPGNYVLTLQNLLNADPDAACAYGNCSSLELDGTVSQTFDFASVRDAMVDDDPYLRSASFFRGNQPYHLIFGLYRSRSVFSLLRELKPIAGCDHFLIVAALLEGKFLYAPETAYLRRMVHPNDTDRDYMARIAGGNHSKNMSRDYAAVGKQMLDWVWKHHDNQKNLSHDREKAFRDLLFQMALKFDTSPAHPFWNCVFYLRKLWRTSCKFFKCKFVPGYAKRKNLSTKHPVRDKQESRDAHGGAMTFQKRKTMPKTSHPSKPQGFANIRNAIGKLLGQGPRSWFRQLYYYLRESAAAGEFDKDVFYLKRRYLRRFHRPLSLENPQTFTEKVQWLKFYDRNPSHTMKADKYAVREFVKDMIGEQHLVKLFGVYDRADDIDFDAIPNRFVLKTTHGCRQNILCSDKSLLDHKETISRLNRWLKTTHYTRYREWVYKNIPPRIVCEEFLEANTEWGLLDYKIFCFHGKPSFIQVIYDRLGEMALGNYDTQWNRLPFGEKSYLASPNDAPCPPCLDEMLHLASALAGDTLFVRVDFYYHNEKIIFGELTFYPDGGLAVFDPVEWDDELGKLLELPLERNIAPGNAV